MRRLYDKASRRALPPSVMQMRIKTVHKVDNDELGIELECLLLGPFSDHARVSVTKLWLPISVLPYSAFLLYRVLPIEKGT